MKTVNIKLSADMIKAVAGEKVKIVAELTEPAYVSVNERRNILGYQNVMRTESKVDQVNIYPEVHEDTTDFIVMADAAGIPHLDNRQSAVEAWYHVDVVEPDPEPADKGNLLYKVGLISDIHMDVEDTHNSEYATDLQNALQFFRQEGVEFICCCGDICQYNDKDYEMFRDYYNTYAWAPTGGTLPFFTPMGNHDYLRIYHKRDSVPAGYDSVEMLWQNNVSVFHEPESDIHFFEYGAKWNAPKKTGKRTIKSKLNYWFEKHGDIYVIMSIDYGASTGQPWDDVIRGFNLLDYNDLYVQQMTEYVKDTEYDRSRESRFDYQFYNAEVLCWLKDIVEANKDRRIFLDHHHFMPNMAGDWRSVYSRLRIWPYPTTDAQRNKFYAGSNTICGLTFHFLNKLMKENKHVINIGGHSHFEFRAQLDVEKYAWPVKLPTGNEVMPLVDDLSTLMRTEYDYQLYSIIGPDVVECAPSVHIPSLSKPTSMAMRSLYGSSQGAVMEVFENAIVFRAVEFKREGSAAYTNVDIFEETIYT